MSRERKIQLLSLVLLGTALTLGMAFRPDLSVNQPAYAADPAPSRAPQRVLYVNPRVETITRAVRMAAEIKPDREALIYGQVSGYVQPHPLEVGTRVDPTGANGAKQLLRISIPELDARVVTAGSRVVRTQAATAEAVAGVLEAKQGLVEAQALARQSKGMIEAAKADLREHEATLHLTETIYNRLQAVVEESKNLVAQDRVDRAEGARNVARHQREESRVGVQKAKDDALVALARVAAAEARVTAAEAGVTAAGAEKNLAESQLQEAKAMQGFGSVQAPFAGVVADRMVDTGDLVMDATRNSGAKPLFRIVADDRLRIRFFVSEPDTPMCSVGNRIEVGIDVLEGEPFLGTVTRMADALDPKTRTMECEAEIDNPKDAQGRKLLRTDMFARVKLFLESHENSLILPARCVRTKKRKSTVMVIGPDDTVQPITVTIGVDDGIRIQILGDDINKDTRVVYRGGNLVRKGAKVRPVKHEGKE